MPYRTNPGNPKEVQVYHNGKWVHKQTCTSAAMAKAAIKAIGMNTHKEK